MFQKLLYFLIVGGVFVPLIGKSVLFYSTGDPTFNTNAPTGGLEDSGWQFQGKFRDAPDDKYLGTPISAHHFITARHISSPSVGEAFYFDGVTHVTISKTSLTSCDLTVWEIEGIFPYYSAIYTKTIQSNDPIVVFGRGTQRGDPVNANGSLVGWKWGAKDFVMRWGENEVESMTTLSGPYGASEPVIKMNFDASGVVNECMLSDKDSGGAVFIQDSDDGQWKLAGINSYVSPVSFSFSSSFSPTFTAAIVDYSFKVSDAEKLYIGVNNYAKEGLHPPVLPASFYSSHVAAHLVEIQGILDDAYDEDADGLPDWWELLHGVDETSMERDGHLDSDIFTNYEEWLADTDPNDSNSFLRVTEYTNATSLVFSSSTNRKYQVQYRSDIADTNETWQTELDWFDGSNAQTAKTVSSATSNRFYHVRAKLR